MINMNPDNVPTIISTTSNAPELTSYKILCGDCKNTIIENLKGTTPIAIFCKKCDKMPQYIIFTEMK